MIADISMRAVRAVVMIVAIFFLKEAHPASVWWNAFSVTDLDSWSPGLWTIDAYIGGMVIYSNGDIGTGGMYSYSDGWVSYWVYASAGDSLAVFEDYEALPLAADLAFTSENAIGGDNINAHRDSEGALYLAIIAKFGLEDPTYYYGWVHLQDKTILESALSEMPLIVGTGQVIPEPSSGLLLLIGVAGLALKRKSSQFQKLPMMKGNTE